MIDTWRIRRVPGGLPGMIRGAARVIPGWSPGRVHSGHAAQPERAWGNILAGHVAHSEASGEFTLAGLAAHSGASGRVLSVWVLGTRGVLARHPEDSLGDGTRCGLFRDTWLTRI